MTKEEFTACAEAYMDMIYRVAYSWTKISCSDEIGQEISCSIDAFLF